MLYNMPTYRSSQQSMSAMGMALSHDFSGLSLPTSVYNPFSRSRDRVGAGHSPSASSSTLRTENTHNSKNIVDSQHTLPVPEDDGLPSYVESLPSYSPTTPPPTQEREPRTAPMYLFFLGFVCPILWLIGTFMLRMPHKEHRGVYDPYMHLSRAEKAAAVREAEEGHRRWKVEMKWAKRCMWASVLFVCIGLAVGMSVWGGLTARRKD